MRRLYTHRRCHVCRHHPLPSVLMEVRDQIHWGINDTSSSDQSSSKSSLKSSTIDPEEFESRDDLKQISLCEASIGLMNLFRKPKNRT